MQFEKTALGLLGSRYLIIAIDVKVDVDGQQLQNVFGAS